uniref:BTB domain-containing protein n=1 Tax=Syphacia muris TaxID=451379 RepID=A0A0N5AA95_9BILA
MESTRIRLNVGGVVFETTVETLNRVDGTMLKAICEKERLDSEEEEIFIDRDPKHFRVILNFLRDGTSILPADEKDIAEMEREADFYGITELVTACRNELHAVDFGDLVKWRTEAVEYYWRSFIRFWVDESLILPFTYERNGHMLAKCVACNETQEPKCSYTFDIPEEAWKAMAHHMLFMYGTVVQLIGNGCCLVRWGENGRVIHLPLSALSKLS